MKKVFLRILTSNKRDWEDWVTDEIRSSVEARIKVRGHCAMMLTGGKTAEALYKHWVVSATWNHSNLNYYFGDERCLPPENTESNYGMVMRSLFPMGLPEDCSIYRIRGEVSNYKAEASRYERILPETIDILLLSVGPDGHIASLFPGSASLSNDGADLVVPIVGPKHPSKRLTITPRVIQSARSIFVLAVGSEKGKVLAEALTKPDNIFDMPVRLTIGGTWLLDSQATAQYQ